jgi:hypothetical protein
MLSVPILLVNLKTRILEAYLAVRILQVGLRVVLGRMLELRRRRLTDRQIRLGSRSRAAGPAVAAGYVVVSRSRRGLGRMAAVRVRVTSNSSD